MNPTTTVPYFDENQSKYKCCCNSVNVKTGTAIIATLKALAVFGAIFQICNGPDYFSTTIGNGGNNNYFRSIAKTLTTTTKSPWFVSSLDQDESLEPNHEDDGTLIQPIAASEPMITDHQGNHTNFGYFHFASTLIYLLMEAIAVSCLIYALRRERPKFVIPQMALILTSLSLQLIGALLIIVCAAFGSESLVQMIVTYMRQQGQELTSGDIQELRRLMPFFLIAVAFGLLIGSMIEYWFFRVLRGYYNYLKDKLAFRGYAGRDGNSGHACYVNGYQPMVEEGSTNDEMNKDMPPAYQEIVKQAAQTADDQQKPPSYKEYA